MLKAKGRTGIFSTQKYIILSNNSLLLGGGGVNSKWKYRGFLLTKNWAYSIFLFTAHTIVIVCASTNIALILIQISAILHFSKYYQHYIPRMQQEADEDKERKREISLKSNKIASNI